MARCVSMRKHARHCNPHAPLPTPRSHHIGGQKVLASPCHACVITSVLRMARKIAIGRASPEMSGGTSSSRQAPASTCRRTKVVRRFGMLIRLLCASASLSNTPDTLCARVRAGCAGYFGKSSAAPCHLHVVNGRVPPSGVPVRLPMFCVTDKR